MQYQVVILSEDAVFARMLEVEFSLWHLHVLVTESPNEQDTTEVLLLDLDSASAPPADYYRKMIGFSRHSAAASEDARSCSMILRRPFQMSRLRQEVLTQIGNYIPMEVPTLPAFSSRSKKQRELVLNAERRILQCDRHSVSVSPQELRILQCLLKHRGQAVSRAMLSEAIGPSGANKTEVYICYLRRKTDSLPEGRLIRTVRGEGYCID